MSGFRSLPYRMFVFGGLALVVGATVASALATADDPGSRLPLYVGLGSVGAYVLMLMAWQLAMVFRAGPEDMIPAREGGPPPGPGDPPLEPSALIAALAVAAPDPGRRRGMTGALDAVRSSVVGGAVLSVAIVVGMTLYMVGGVDGVWRPFGETGPGIPYALLPVFAIIALLLVRLPFSLRGAVAAGDAWLEPLGLRLTGLPQSVLYPRLGGGGVGHTVSGPTVIGGRRHGREVRIELEARRCLTVLSGAVPAFRVAGDRRSGRLSADDGAPAGVAEALAGLSPHPRWRRVEVEGGPRGVTVSRPVRGAGHAQALWLDDLWLAERLTGAL